MFESSWAAHSAQKYGRSGFQHGKISTLALSGLDARPAPAPDDDGVGGPAAGPPLAAAVVPLAWADSSLSSPGSLESVR